MKIFLLATLSIILATTVLLGNVNWYKQKKDVISKISTYEFNTASKEDYLYFATNWPNKAQEQFKMKLQKNEVFRILLVGSKAIGNLNTGLLPSVKDSIQNSFDSHVTIDTIMYDGTSSNFVLNNETKKIIDQSPDMIILEPFLLADNNVLQIKTTLTNISTIIEDTQGVLPNSTFILQPANQIYNASLYPRQVAALKEFATLNNITYLNHWENWPKGDSTDVLNYINQDDTPNKKGYEIWSSYITDFLIKK